MEGEREYEERVDTEFEADGNEAKVELVESEKEEVLGEDSGARNAVVEAVLRVLLSARAQHRRNSSSTARCTT